MKKTLALASIKNKRLRESGYSDLVKTAVHRYHYDGVDNYRDWYYDILDDADRIEISKHLDYVPKKKKYYRSDAEKLKKYLKQLGVEVDIIGSVARDGVSEHDIDFWVRNHHNTPKFREYLKVCCLNNATFTNTDWGGIFFAKTLWGSLDFFFDISEFDY